MATIFFGDEVFVLMNVNGIGYVFLKSGGMFIKRKFLEEEELWISSGSLFAFTPGMDYDVSMMKGIKNIMFGGEGLFINTLNGPIDSWLHSTKQDRFASRTVSRLSSIVGMSIGFGMPIRWYGRIAASDNNDSETTHPKITSEDLGNDDVITTALSCADEFIQSCHNTTIASSGFNINRNFPDSPSLLFWDVAANNENFSTNDDNNYGFNDDDTASFSTKKCEDNNYTTTNAQHNDSLFENDDDQTVFSAEEKESSQKIDYDSASEEKWLFYTLLNFFNDDE